MWGVTHPDEAKAKIAEQRFEGKITNLEEQALSLVGKDVYEKLIKGYTTKQWRKDPKELPASIIKRLPVRFTYNNNYFNDTYQGIPIGGYTQIFEKLLEGIDIELGVDYFEDDLPPHDKVIYTGPIDKFFNYKYDKLEYKTTTFDTKKVDTDNYQGCAVMNYTDSETEYTRIIEHKHFEPDTKSKTSYITYEYPTEYKAETSEPYYPVNDTENNSKYRLYKEEADKLDNIHFGGRLAEYKYYDMHQVIASALTFIKKEIKK
jgi:UDP-galactopyranose mutase